MVSLFSLINYSYSSFLELCHHFSMSLFMFTCQLRPKRIFPQHAFRFFGYDHPWQWLAENCATSDIFVGIDWVTPISKNMNSKFFQYITFECVQILYQCPTENPQKDMQLPFTLHLLRHTSTDWSLVFAPPILVCLPGMPAEATAQRRVRKVDTSSWNTANMDGCSLPYKTWAILSSTNGGIHELFKGG